MKIRNQMTAPKGLPYVINIAGSFQTLPYSVTERMAPFLTQALIGNREAYTVLRFFARDQYPEYLDAVKAIKEKYGYED